MDARRQFFYQIRHVFRQIQRIKTWQLLILLILSGFVTATFLRLNNIGMMQLRDSVLTADKEAKDGDVANRMYDLQRYSANHMNAETGQFDLVNQYQRDAQKAIDAATDDDNPNGNINAKAAAICDPQFSYYTQAYLQCFLDELNKYPAAPDPSQTLTLPNAALYRHSFASPVWSPDFAGFSLLISLIIALIITIRLLHKGFLYLLLKLRYRGIGS